MGLLLRASHARPEGLAVKSRNIIQRVLNPRFLS